MLQYIKLFGDSSLFNESATRREGFTEASRRLQEGSVKPSRSVSLRRLRDTCKAPPRTLRGGCTEGLTKAPWRVHEASSKGPGRNFVGFLNDDACDRVGSILCFVGPELLL